MGGATGVNTIVTPNDFSNPIVRVTDANTNPNEINRSYHVTPSGANADIIWNADSTMLLVTRENASSLLVIPFDPTTMQAGTAIPGTGGTTTSRQAKPSKSRARLRRSTRKT